MTRRQMALILGVNAVVSALITLLLVLVILPALNVRTTVGPTATLPTGVADRVTQSVGEITATPTPEIYVVKAGDTISGLAMKFDLPEQDIIAANQLQNPNFLQVGMELIIPVGGLPQVTATFTPAPTPTDTPIPFEPPSTEMTATAAAEAGATATGLPTPVPSQGDLQVVITEIVGAGQVDQEGVVITNSGTTLADMQGWTLSDAEGNVYTFPNFRLWGNGSSVTVHTRIGQDGNPPANFFWGKLEAIWSVGEEATLKDAQGNVVATYTVQP
jgi:LysM repeat protein